MLPFIVHMIMAARRRKPMDRAVLLTSVVCLLICGCTALAAEGIPLCPNCEGISAQELGVFAYWIKTDP